MLNQLLLGTSTYFIHVSFQLSVACQDEQAPIVLTNLFGTLQTSHHSPFTMCCLYTSYHSKPQMLYKTKERYILLR